MTERLLIFGIIVIVGERILEDFNRRSNIDDDEIIILVVERQTD